MFPSITPGVVTAMDTVKVSSPSVPSPAIRIISIHSRVEVVEPAGNVRAMVPKV